jgi:dynein heavy chain
MLTLLDAVLARAAAAGGELGAAAAERAALFCAAWGLAGTLDGDDRVGFDDCLRKLSSLVPGTGEVRGGREGRVGAAPARATPPADPHPSLQPTDTIFDHALLDACTDFEPWAARVPAWAYPRSPSDPDFAALVVPTVESVRIQTLLALVHSVGKVRE